MSEVTDRIIILKAIRYGEDDLIIHGINAQGSKSTYFAKYAFRSRKRFGGGVLEPSHFIQIVYKPAPEGQMNKLLEAKLLESFPGVRKDYERLETALLFVGLVDRVSLEGMIDSAPLFDLLGHSLRAAEKSATLSLLKLHFEMKLLAFQGVLPHFEESDIFSETPIKEHEKINLNPEAQFRLQHFVNDLLSNYLA